MSDPFDYVQPDDAQLAQMKQTTEAFKATYKCILHNTAKSAERTIAIRKLQEARMWTNVAILGITID